MDIYSGVILTDTLMFLLFTSVAMLALIFLVQDAGGWAAGRGAADGLDCLAHDSQVLWLTYGTTLSDGTMIFPSALRDIQGGTGTSLTRLMK